MQFWALRPSITLISLFVWFEGRFSVDVRVESGGGESREPFCNEASVSDPFGWDFW